ncbi:hypothetical protein LINPERPRIM_LOCUS41231 [Linum perenne]
MDSRTSMMVTIRDWEVLDSAG